MSMTWEQDEHYHRGLEWLELQMPPERLLQISRDWPHLFTARVSQIGFSLFQIEQAHAVVDEMTAELGNLLEQVGGRP